MEMTGDWPVVSVPVRKCWKMRSRSASDVAVLSSRLRLSACAR